ncbi:MAG: hypothetical protein FJ276_33420 [Planctomycetes bacterium]|nr:hypothetical protein [Planctomycetota bacterium]
MSASPTRRLWFSAIALVMVVPVLSAVRPAQADDFSFWIDGLLSEPETPIASQPPAASDRESTADLEPKPEKPAKDKAEPCDAKKLKAIEKKVATSHKPLFHDNNFDYLCDPCYCDWHLGDRLKRLGVGQFITFDVGGQYRMRWMDETNHRGLGLTGVDDDFLLHRTRVYSNVEVGERFRFFAEYSDAESNGERFPPRPPEVNRSDMLNLFGDVMLCDLSPGPVWARVGRQELLYGSQRVVSPLDWANSRRTFEGYKVFWKGEKWSVDSFYTHPVYPDARNFDSPEENHEFMGFWGTCKPCEHRTLDLFYLAYNDSIAGFKYDTLGGRWLKTIDNWQFEVEGAAQFGENTDRSDHAAGFCVAGLSRKFPGVAWEPMLSAYYDWASGSDDRGAGHGYHHLFPLAHRYLGFMDLFGRRNLETPNVQLLLKPHEKIEILVWYYYFFLENKNDTPYSIVMTPYNPANAPASADLGQEIDLALTYRFTPRASALIGYSHFFAGAYYELTPGVAYRDDADFAYAQFQVDF